MFFQSLTGSGWYQECLKQWQKTLISLKTFGYAGDGCALKYCMSTKSIENERTSFSDPFKIQTIELFKLIKSLDLPSKDILNVMEFIKMPKPLVSLDFCYAGECDEISIEECFSTCSLTTSYDSATISVPKRC